MHRVGYNVTKTLSTCFANPEKSSDWLLIHITMNPCHHPMSFPKCAKYTKPKITRVKSLF